MAYRANDQEVPVFPPLEEHKGRCCWRAIALEDPNPRQREAEPAGRTLKVSQGESLFSR
jgi:hypothetical protein